MFGILEASLNVFRLKVGEFLQNLLGGQSICQEVQDVDHPDAHASDAGPAPALLSVNRYAIHSAKILHSYPGCTLKFS